MKCLSVTPHLEQVFTTSLSVEECVIGFKGIIITFKSRARDIVAEDISVTQTLPFVEHTTENTTVKEKG